MALLKFSELPVEEVNKIAPGSEAARDLAVEVHAIREELTGRSVDSTRARRRLREQLGKGDGPPEDRQMHRSPASRELFDAAAKLADDSSSEVFAARHLLQAMLASPTPAMAHVLAEAPASPAKPAEHAKTPLLDKHGRDLTRLAASGQLPRPSGRDVECRSLAQVLAQPNCRGVWLVTDGQEVAESVVAGLAYLAIGSSGGDLKGKRIIDLTGIALKGGQAKEGIQLLEQFLAEVAAMAEAILFVPPVESQGSGRSAATWTELLKTAVPKGKFRFLCRVSPATYQERLAKDPQWKRLAKAMWIRGERTDVLPDEL
jgi:ATP-dependent Clp protease ATP-binding subunit ClpC